MTSNTFLHSCFVSCGCLPKKILYPPRRICRHEFGSPHNARNCDRRSPEVLYLSCAITAEMMASLRRFKVQAFRSRSIFVNGFQEKQIYRFDRFQFRAYWSLGYCKDFMKYTNGCRCHASGRLPNKCAAVSKMSRLERAGRWSRTWDGSPCCTIWDGRGNRIASENAPLIALRQE